MLSPLSPAYLTAGVYWRAMWLAILGTLIAAFAVLGWWGVVAWAGLWVAFFGLALASERR